MAKQTPKLMVVGLKSSWDDGLQFERIVYGKTKLGLGLDLAQFNRSAPTLSRRQRDHAVWLVSPAHPKAMSIFASGWRRENRLIRGKRYDVWVPVTE